MPNETSSRTLVIMFVVLSIAIIGGAVLLVVTRPEPVQITINPPVPTSTPEPTPTPAPILVYVTGAVNEPETTVELPVNSRVQDAIDATGGITDDADLTRINVVGILRDGDQVYVPTLGEDTPVSIATPSGSGVVNVNTATSLELQTLPGVGPALAERIIVYRQEFGAFSDIEDLDNVSGIGPALLEGFDGLIEF